MSVAVQDALWVIGVLLVAVTCLLYVRSGLRDGDPVLVVGGTLAAAAFTLACLLYLWLVW